ncbi:MAG: hypothetical protein HKN33_18915 [Pyrinomonadaceae bacterium]|nr:hypothetical protein [Pyrinomonadaceae bacterium]
MRITNFLLILSLMCCFAACNGSGGGVEGIFDDMQKALKNGDEDLFKQHWTENGYRNALVKKSGMSGSELFQEGSGEGWYPRPDLSKNRHVGETLIVQAKIWSIEKNRSVDEVYFLLVKENGTWKVAGGGEDIEEVLAADTNLLSQISRRESD